MTRPTGMPKGRPATLLGRMAEGQVEAVATGHELIAADRVELADLRTVAALLSRPRPEVEMARRVVGRLLERDLVENHRHRHIVRTLAPGGAFGELSAVSCQPSAVSRGGVAS